MEHDPHEPGIRDLAYRKVTDDERYLAKLNTVLEFAELSTEGELLKGTAQPIIYIVGAPRSGTTLLSQLVSRYLPVGYINNLIARFWLRPSVGIRLSEILLGEDDRKRIAFRSSFGTTTGVHEPHEFGYFWRHWLKLDEFSTHKIPDDGFGMLDAEGLRRALVEEILGEFRCPVVFKNVICGLQAEYLTKIYPNSLFIHIKRDPLITAASILKSRRERFGSYSTWWSLKPSTWPFDRSDEEPATEVAMQVFECRREINEELHKANVNSLQVSYKGLCMAPFEVLIDICKNMERFGCSIHPLEDNIATFNPSGKIDLPDAVLGQLKVAVNNIFQGEEL